MVYQWRRCSSTIPVECALLDALIHSTGVLTPDDFLVRWVVGKEEMSWPQGQHGLGQRLFCSVFLEVVRDGCQARRVGHGSKLENGQTGRMYPTLSHFS